jgi:hypothetical protein
MALGKDIIITANPKGNFIEGIVSGTPKPGTVMQIEAAVEPVGGRYSWEVFDAGATGDQRIIAVLRADTLSGKLETAAYVDNERCFLYFPIPGDELNMLFNDVSGTGDSIAIGDLFNIEDATGQLIATTSTESEPFFSLETRTAGTADVLVHCMFTGY